MLFQENLLCSIKNYNSFRVRVCNCFQWCSVWVWQLRNCQGWMEEDFPAELFSLFIATSRKGAAMFLLLLDVSAVLFCSLWSLWNMHALVSPCHPSTVYLQQWYSKSGSWSACRPFGSVSSSGELFASHWLYPVTVTCY